MNEQEIVFTDWKEGEFSFNGNAYYMNVQNLMKAVADNMGMIEVEIIDTSVYDGSPYKSQLRPAEIEDVEICHMKKFILENKVYWKSLKE